MNEGTLISTEIDEAQDKEKGSEKASQRKSLDLEWIESEWFEVWLRLAREGQEKNRNQ